MQQEVQAQARVALRLAEIRTAKARRPAAVLDAQPHVFSDQDQLAQIRQNRSRAVILYAIRGGGQAAVPVDSAR